MGPPYHVAKRAVRIVGGKLDVGRHEDPFFFGLHPMFGGKLDVGRREDLFYFGLHPMFGEYWTSESVKTFFFFLVFTRCFGVNRTSGPRKMISGGGHALPSFGPVANSRVCAACAATATTATTDCTKRIKSAL